MPAHQRDLVGYGATPPNVEWPNGARLAVSLVVNYEEGSEKSFAAGDKDQEQLTEWGAYPFPAHIRNLAMESMYEYGSRVGVWRILDVLQSHAVPATFFACAVAFEEAPDVARAVVAAGHEVCCHGYRWEEVFRLTREDEREHIRLAIESLTRTTGQRPQGWYCRYGPSVHTRELVVEEGGFLYDSDAYNDDVPYFVTVNDTPHLVVPYAPDTNDIQFWLGEPLATAEDFFTYLRDSFDTLYAEAVHSPKMMSIGLHCRIIGRPGRIAGLSRFIEYAKSQPGTWFTTRTEIAESWWRSHPDTPRPGSVAAAVDPGVHISGGVPTRLQHDRGHVTSVALGAPEPAGSIDSSSSEILMTSGTSTAPPYALGRGHFPAGTESDAILHDVDEWMFVVAGTGELRTPASSTRFTANDLLRIPAGTWHCVASGPEGAVISLFGFPSNGYPSTRRAASLPPADEARVESVSTSSEPDGTRTDAGDDASSE